MKKKSILLVEDDLCIREVLTELLESEGYTIQQAENGQDALNHLAVMERPGLILLDLMMPVKDAYGFREVQALDPRFKDIPVVLMTADNQIEARQKQLGIERYLRKPLELEDVLEMVARYF